jgi:hypothetical protein
MAAGGAAAAAAIAQAIKASGVVVRLNAEEFRKVLIRVKDPLVVIAQGGIFSTKYQCLTSYKGLAFYTKSSTPLDMPAGVEVVTAERIWIPG